VLKTSLQSSQLFLLLKDGFFGVWTYSFSTISSVFSAFIFFIFTGGKLEISGSGFSSSKISLTFLCPFFIWSSKSSFVLKTSLQSSQLFLLLKDGFFGVWTYSFSTISSVFSAFIFFIFTGGKLEISGFLLWAWLKSLLVPARGVLSWIWPLCWWSLKDFSELPMYPQKSHFTSFFFLESSFSSILLLDFSIDLSNFVSLCFFFSMFL